VYRDAANIMALPVIDNSIDLEHASKNVVKYLAETTNIERVFKIEALKIYINKTCTVARKSYLDYIIEMYQ